MFRMLLLTLALAAAASEASAQYADRIRTGDRVRITPAPSSGDRVLFVTAVDSHAIVALGERTRREVRVPFESVRVLERMTGSASRRRGFVRGVAYGFVGGAVIGAALGAYAGGIDRNESTQGAVAGGLMLGAAGASLGGLLGAASAGGRWELVTPRRSVLMIPAPGDGVALGVKARF